MRLILYQTHLDNRWLTPSYLVHYGDPLFQDNKDPLKAPGLSTGATDIRLCSPVERHCVWYVAINGAAQCMGLLDLFPIVLTLRYACLDDHVRTFLHLG